MPQTIPAFNIYLGQPTFNQLVITTPPGTNLVSDFHRLPGGEVGDFHRAVFDDGVDYFSSWYLGWPAGMRNVNGGGIDGVGNISLRVFPQKNSLGAVSSLRFSLPFFFHPFFPRFLHPLPIFWFWAPAAAIRRDSLHGRHLRNSAKMKWFLAMAMAIAMAVALKTASPACTLDGSWLEGGGVFSHFFGVWKAQCLLAITHLKRVKLCENNVIN